jgi:hypothetical protein
MDRNTGERDEDVLPKYNPASATGSVPSGKLESAVHDENIDGLMLLKYESRGTAASRWDWCKNTVESGGQISM